MTDKVTFDGENARIIVGEGVTELNFDEDVYSAWKRWVVESDNAKYPQAIRVVGGDSISATKDLGSTFFLMNGWRIRPDESDGRLSIVGNIYTDPSGDSILVPTLATHNVLVEISVSNLTDSTIAQLPEIEYSSFGGGVWIDVVYGSSGTAFPLGTPKSPVDNITDALSIAVYRGFKKIFIRGDFTFSSGIYVVGYEFYGEGMQKSTFTFETGSVTALCFMKDAIVTGDIIGVVGFENCHISNIGSTYSIPSSQTITAKSCLIDGSLTLPSAYSGTLKVLDCWSNTPGAAMPGLDLGGSYANVLVRNYSGDIQLKNCTNSNCYIEMDFISGHLTLDSSVTAGSFILRGAATLTNLSTGTTIDSDGLISKQAVAIAVEEEIGTEIEYGAFQGKVWLDTVNGISGTTYPIGTPLQPVNNIVDARTIALSRGFDTIHLLSDLTVATGDSVDNLTLESSNWLSITVEAGASLENTVFFRLSVYGVMGGFWNTLIDCWIYNITNLCGWLRGGSFEYVELAPYTPENLGQSYFDSLVPMYPGIPSVLTMSDRSVVSFTNAIDIYQINSMTDGCMLDFNLGGGTLIMDSSCTGGDVTVVGIGSLIDNSTGTTINSDGLIGESGGSGSVDPDEVAVAVWNALSESYGVPGTMGWLQNLLEHGIINRPKIVPGD